MRHLVKQLEYGDVHMAMTRRPSARDPIDKFAAVGKSDAQAIGADHQKGRDHDFCNQTRDIPFVRQSGGFATHFTALMG